MTTSPGRETAKIYAFPVKARLSANERDRENRTAARNAASVPMMDVGGWYHGAAIREANETCEPRN